MKMNSQIALLALCTLLLSANVQAEEELKRLSIGLGTYAFTVNFDDQFIANDEFSGLAIHGALAANDNIAVKGAIYSLDNDYSSEIESSGYDLTFVAGTGLATEGFKIYGGLGIFKDTWSRPGYESLEFSGTQIVVGLGYNWDAVSIDLSVGVRDADEYAEIYQGTWLNSVEISTTSSALTLSARF